MPRFNSLPDSLREDPEGVIRVGRTRVPLDTVVYEFEQGSSPEEIVHNFTSLELPDVYEAVAFYLRHRQAVDGYLEERRRRAAEVRREVQARFPRQDIRERLLARRRGTPPQSPDAA